MLQPPGSSWGFGALLKDTSVVVLKEERVLVIHSPTNNPCRTQDSNPQSLDYESDSLTIRPRPRLPPSSEMYSLHLTHPKWTHTRSSGQPCYSARGAVGGSHPQLEGTRRGQRPPPPGGRWALKVRVSSDTFANDDPSFPSYDFSTQSFKGSDTFLALVTKSFQWFPENFCNIQGGVDHTSTMIYLWWPFRGIFSGWEPFTCIKNNGLFVYLHAHMQTQMSISNLWWVDKTPNPHGLIVLDLCIKCTNAKMGRAVQLIHTTDFTAFTEDACVWAVPDGSSEAGTTRCRRWPSYSSSWADNSPSQTYCCSRRRPQTGGSY